LTQRAPDGLDGRADLLIDGQASGAKGVEAFLASLSEPIRHPF